MDYSIEKVREHYVIYIDGKFYCTAESYADAVEEVESARETIQTGK